MKRRRGVENLALRLAHREVAAAPPGASVRMAAPPPPPPPAGVHFGSPYPVPPPHARPLFTLHDPSPQTPQSRRLYENVVPDAAVPGLAPPPNTVLSCFTPCSRFLVAFQPVSNEVVAYAFKGLSISTTSDQQEAQQRQADAAEAGPGAAAAAAAQPQGSQQAAPPQQQPGQLGQQAGGAVAFSDMFEERWRCCPCPSRQEQISSDVCLGAWARSCCRGLCCACACACACMAGAVSLVQRPRRPTDSHPLPATHTPLPPQLPTAATCLSAPRRPSGCLLQVPAAPLRCCRASRAPLCTW